jgi:type VI secretion system secreted protein Hcp
MPTYLAIPGIQGDAAAARRQGQIAVDGWSFGCATASAAHAGSGGGAGRFQFSEATFSGRGGRASPVLLQYCATGRAVPEAVLTQDSTGDENGGPITEVRFSDVRVTAYTVTGVADARADEFRLSFTRVTFSVRTHSLDGTVGAPVSTTQPAPPAPPATEPPLPTPGSGGVWRPRTPLPNP